MILKEIKAFLKSFLEEPTQGYEIKELEDILKSFSIVDVIIINSDFYRDNQKLLHGKNIQCFDVDLEVYKKNKPFLENERIKHFLITDNTIQTNKLEVDLVILETANKMLFSLIESKLVIEKDS